MNELSSWQQAFEVGVETDCMIPLMDGGGGQPGIGQVIGSERFGGA
jgi:hypothetical protein